MVFFTGGTIIPPYATLEFDAGKLPRLSTCATCDNVLRIPTKHTEYETFKEYLQMGVLGHDGFGAT